MLPGMVLALSLAIVIGVGGPSGDDEAPTIPDSPASALSLQGIDRSAPVIVAEPQALPADESGPPVQQVPPVGRGQTPEQILGVMTFMLILMGVGAPRRERVEAAIASVRKDLRDNLFSDVTHSDLASIEETLVGLPPGERALAVDALSDREVAVWMRELDGFGGSYSPNEEARLFAGLVPGLRGESLTRLGVGGKGKEVVAALSTHGSSRQAVVLARELAGSLEGRSKMRRLIPDLLDSVEAEVLEAEVSSWIAHGELSQRLEQFFGVAGEEVLDLGAGYRLDGAAALARAGAGFTEPAVKAALFVELARHMAIVEGKRWAGSMNELLAGTTQLLRSDVVGVVRQLNHGADPHGNTTSRWVEQMIDEDRIDELDVIFSELLGGTDRLGHFTDRGIDLADPYPNASNLGYFVGSYQLAIEQMADDAEGRIWLIRLLFAIVTGVVPGPKGGSLGLPLGPLVDLHARQVIDGFRGQASDVKQALWGLAKPRTDDGLLWNGEGTTQFQDGWEEVIEVR